MALGSQKEIRSRGRYIVLRVSFLGEDRKNSPPTPDFPSDVQLTPVKWMPLS
jgi:hypothetical protein